MNLALDNILIGRAGINNAITYNIFGRNTTGSLPLENPLAQGTFGTLNKVIYTADRDVTITEIQLVNATGFAVSGVVLFLNATRVAGAFTIPANATFSYSNGVWNTDTNTTIFTGVNTNQITVSATAPLNPQLNDLWVEI